MRKDGVIQTRKRKAKSSSLFIKRTAPDLRHTDLALPTPDVHRGIASTMFHYVTSDSRIIPTEVKLHNVFIFSLFVLSCVMLTCTLNGYE